MRDVDGNDWDRDSQRWHFERRMTLGEVFTLISLLAMIYFKGNAIVDEFRIANSQMDKRVSILEDRAAMQKQVDAAQDASTRDGQRRIESSLIEIQRYLRDQKSAKQ